MFAMFLAASFFSATFKTLRLHEILVLYIIKVEKYLEGRHDGTAKTPQPQQPPMANALWKIGCVARKLKLEMLLTRHIYSSRIHNSKLKLNSMAILYSTRNLCVGTKKMQEQGSSKDNKVLCWIWSGKFRFCSTSEVCVLKQYAVLPKMESCFKDLRSKTFQWGKKGLLSKKRTKKGPVIELLRTFSRYFRNNAKRS